MVTATQAVIVHCNRRRVGSYLRRGHRGPTRASQFLRAIDERELSLPMTTCSGSRMMLPCFVLFCFVVGTRSDIDEYWRSSSTSSRRIRSTMAQPPLRSCCTMISAVDNGYVIGSSVVFVEIYVFLFFLVLVVTIMMVPEAIICWRILSSFSCRRLFQSSPAEEETNSLFFCRLSSIPFHQFIYSERYC